MSDNVYSIYSRQNEPDILSALLAQRRTYSRAKTILYRGVGITLFLSVAAAFLTTYFASTQLAALSTLLIVIAFFSLTWIQGVSADTAERAAKIQQYIDTTLFLFPKVTLELARNEIDRIKEQHPYSIESDPKGKLKNWYFEKLPEENFYRQIFLAQKVNVDYELRLREWFKNFNLVFAIIVLLLFLVPALFFNPQVSYVIAVFCCVFPLEQFFVTQYRNLRRNIKFLEKINTVYNELDKSFDKDSDQELKDKLLSFQFMIYEHRKNCVLIPDWVYNRLNKQNSTTPPA